MRKLNENELIEFISIYTKKKEQLCYDMYIESKQKDLPSENLLAEMFDKKDNLLFSLIKQPCDHDKLITLLKCYLEEDEKSKLRKRCKELGVSIITHPIEEPLAEWIFNYNYLLAYPLLGRFEKNDTLLRENPEMILSYVYIYLRLHFKNENFSYSFHQPNIDLIYGDFFEKPSVFTKWGLLPVNENRTICAFDNPVRIYDQALDKTIFIHMGRPLAIVLEKLMNEGCVRSLAVRGEDSYIYNGENHFSFLCEAVEKGLIFSLNLRELPTITKLYCDNCFFDTLWILKDSQSLTFEELCDNFHTDGETVVTQMIHLEYTDQFITHLDHEYIFYSLEEYEERINNPLAKGHARKRVKTFKIDKSMIPLDYPCKMYRIINHTQEEITVPFIYFVLNSFFEHKDLLEEYFSKFL